MSASAAVLPLVGGVLIVIGLSLLACAVLTRRTGLIADEEGLTYRDWRQARTISWRRLSSIQYKASSGELVVVNDSGRAEMDIPVHFFDRQALHDWLDTIPARTPARSSLLR